MNIQRISWKVNTSPKKPVTPPGGQSDACGAESEVLCAFRVEGRCVVVRCRQSRGEMPAYKV
jgi:hypothetical protein